MPATIDPYSNLANMDDMETTVPKDRSKLSELLQRAESGEEVLIRWGRGPDAKIFSLSPVEIAPRRILAPDPQWAGKIHYRDKDIWASERALTE